MPRAVRGGRSRRMCSRELVNWASLGWGLVDNGIKSTTINNDRGERDYLCNDWIEILGQRVREAKSIDKSIVL